MKIIGWITINKQKIINNGITILLILMCVNYLLTTAAYWMKNPELSRMEIFIHTPSHFMWDFEAKNTND